MCAPSMDADSFNILFLKSSPQAEFWKRQAKYWGSVQAGVTTDSADPQVHSVGGPVKRSHGWLPKTKGQSQ